MLTGERACCLQVPFLPRLLHQDGDMRLHRNTSSSPSSLQSREYPRRITANHLSPAIHPLLLLLPQIESLIDVRRIPPTLHGLLPIYMQGWNPVYVFLLPLLLPFVLDIDRLQLELASLSDFCKFCLRNLWRYSLSSTFSPARQRNSNKRRKGNNLGQ